MQLSQNGELSKSRVFRCEGAAYINERLNTELGHILLTEGTCNKQVSKDVRVRTVVISSFTLIKSHKYTGAALYTLQPSRSPIGLSTYHMYVDELDTPITMSEVETAIHHLNPDKPAGDDNIRSEFILYGR